MTTRQPAVSPVPVGSADRSLLLRLVAWTRSYSEDSAVGTRFSTTVPSGSTPRTSTVLSSGTLADAMASTSKITRSVARGATTVTDP
jgi:hypothetical protein